MESIHDLFQKVREHPDFAGGTVFTREDVAEALMRGHDDPRYDAADLKMKAAALTADQLHQSDKAIENYIFQGAYSWTEAIQDNVEE